MAFPFPDSPVVANPVVTPPISVENSIVVVNNGFIRAFNAVANLAANYQLLNTRYIGAGRFSGATIDTSKNAQVGTGLTAHLMNDDYLFHGRIYVIDEPEPAPYKVVDGIKPDKPDGVEVFVGLDENDEPVTADEWQFDTFPTGDDLASVAGLLHIGRVVTNLTSVVSIDPSTREGYGLIRPRSSGGGGGGGDVTTADLEAAVAALRAEHEADITRLEALIAAGGVTTEQPELAHLLRAAGVASVGITEVNPEYGDRDEGENIVVGIREDGLVVGTATLDSETRTIGP